MRVPPESDGMQVVELGGVRLHVLAVHPGLPGEAERVAQALRRLDPARVLVDLDADDALRLRASLAPGGKPFAPGFVDDLLAAESARRFAPDARPGEHPLATAARVARDKRADLVPIRALGDKPGLFARSRARKAAGALAASGPQELADALGPALKAARAWDREAEVEAAHKRVLKALADGRAPVVLVAQAHRAGAFLAALAATGRIPA